MLKSNIFGFFTTPQANCWFGRAHIDVVIYGFTFICELSTSEFDVCDRINFIELSELDVISRA